MNTFDAIKERRSVKQFDAEHKFTKEEKTKLLNAAAHSPTAFNIQHWRFVVVEDKILRQKIRENAWDQSQVTDCSMLVIICADTNAWKKNPQRYWERAAPEIQDFILPAIAAYYDGKDQVQRDECMRSCGIAAQTLMLAAKSMSYDSCPMDGFDFDKVAELINLPEDHLISMFVAIGKATAPAHPKSGQLPLTEIVIEDRF